MSARGSRFPPHPHPTCPTCHDIVHLLIVAEPDAVRCAVEAQARGPGFGVAVAVPEQLMAETPEERVALEVARAVGYYVSVEPIAGLLRWLPPKSHDPGAIAGIRRQLQGPPPEGQVHVLAVMDGCASACTIRADPAIIVARERQEHRERRVEELIALAEPAIRSRAAEAQQRTGVLFIVAEPSDPIVAKLTRTPPPGDAPFYLGLHSAPDAISALPLEGLEADDAVRLSEKLVRPPPAGSVRVVAVFDGHLGLASRSLS
jgi:hypothetical protein